MDVAHLLPAFGFGGAEIAVAELVRRALARGERRRVLVPAGGAAEEGLRALLGDAVLGLPCGPARERFDVAARFVLAARRACAMAGLVHGHLPSPDRIGMCLGGSAGRPLVLSFEALPEPLASTRRDVLLGRFTPHALLLRASARLRPLALVGLTRHARRVLMEAYPAVRVEAIANAPPVREAPPLHLPFGQGTRLLAVGRLSREKGARRLVEALGRMRDAGPWSLCVVGEGDERAEVERAARQAGIAERVRFLGSVPIAVTAGMADILVSTSYTEGMPLALLEAMRARLAVVVSPIPAHVEMLEGIDGALLPADEARWPEQLARAIGSAQLRRDIAAEAHRRQQAQYTDVVQDAAYAALYRHLAGGPPCASPG